MRSQRRGARRLLAAAVRSLNTMLALSLCGAALGSGCSWLNRRSREQLATSLQELVPHGDRDHFVYITRHSGGDAATLQVEHVTALDDRGAFEVTMSENGTATGRLRARDDGTRILLLDEDDFTRDIRLSYDPPLLYLEVPLFTGEWRTTSTARVSRLSDGEPAGSLLVTQVVSASAAAAVKTVLGIYPHPIAVRTIRTLQGPEGDIQLDTTMLLVPGVGEIRSTGGVSGTPVLERELACALIGSRAIGDCRQLNVQPQEGNRAGSPDVQ